jgi:hypothetical protein
LLSKISTWYPSLYLFHVPQKQTLLASSVKYFRIYFYSLNPCIQCMINTSEHHLGSH